MNCYIFHVIGTLQWEHIERAAESLNRQQFNWHQFYLYNGGPFDSSKILRLFDLSKFTWVEELSYDPDTPKSTPADWEQIKRQVSGFDRYLIHKADFYLGSQAMYAISNTWMPDPWFVQFHKLNMKEHANIDLVRELADSGWHDIIHRPDVTQSGRNSAGFKAVAVPVNPELLDGVMHAFNDAARERYVLGDEERNTRWGRSISIQDWSKRAKLLTHPQAFAMHMWHDVPEKTDPYKLVEGERF